MFIFRLQLCGFLTRFVKIIGVIFGIVIFASVAHSETPNKILYIDSYHSGYPWSDGILRGIESRLLVEDVWFKVHHMDTKRKRTPADIDHAVKVTKQLIDQLQPDIVIASDDNAAKYIIQPYFEGAETPVVFCGINWDASVYGLPYSNTTGMIEVSLIASVVDLLSRHANGKRIGFLAQNNLSSQRNSIEYARVLQRDFDDIAMVDTFEKWKDEFLRLQSGVDMLLIDNTNGMPGWEPRKSVAFVSNNVRIPTGSTNEWMAPLSLITIAMIPEEQGWWSANSAIKILNGTKPSDIPVSKNREGKLLVNLDLAQRIGVTFSQEILEVAEIIHN